MSRQSERIYAPRALHAGAAGYWIKNGSAAELLRVVETVAGGKIHVSPLIASLALENRSKLCLRTRQFYFRGTSSTGTHPPGTDRDELEGWRGCHRSIWNLHEKIVAELFKRPITREQSKDTGMAMVLLLLLASAAFKREILVTVAIIALVVDMTVPRLYRPGGRFVAGSLPPIGHSGLQNSFNAGFLWSSDPDWRGAETSGL